MATDESSPTHLTPRPGFPPGVNLIGGRNAAPVHRQLAREFYAPIIPIVAELHQQGLSLRAIARELNQRGIEARYGKGRWSAPQVKRVLARAQAEAAAAAELQEILGGAAAAGDRPGPQTARFPMPNFQPSSRADGAGRRTTPPFKEDALLSAENCAF